MIDIQLIVFKNDNEHLNHTFTMGNKASALQFIQRMISEYMPKSNYTHRYDTKNNFAVVSVRTSDYYAEISVFQNLVNIEEIIQSQWQSYPKARSNSL